MIRISVCMIVKNEEARLSTCLDSLRGIYDELIVVDTGSTDRTKEIAAGYGAQLFDYSWKDDFADARNTAFAHATGDYIYSADADEELDDENRQRFLVLKRALGEQDALDVPIDIVQMYYCNQLSARSVYNYDRELRPKLFRRIREWHWEDPIHEMVRTEPVIFDSEIEIIHRPGGDHAARDLAAFRKAADRGVKLSKRLHGMYARELFMAGKAEDFAQAMVLFNQSCEDPERSVDEIREASCVCARAARLSGDVKTFFKFALKETAAKGSSEMCCELGEYYAAEGDDAEAALWYYNAAFETECLLDIRRGHEIPLEALAECYERLGDPETAKSFRDQI